MRKISFIILIMFACFSHSQTIIRKKNTTAFYTDHFSFNKNTLKKHGQFNRMDKLRPDTLISGLYDNDKRIGRWGFFDNTGNLHLQYDYDKNTFTHIADTIKNIKIANKMIAEAVKIYNNERLHWSLELKTPQEVHRKYNQQPYKSYARKVA